MQSPPSLATYLGTSLILFLRTTYRENISLKQSLAGYILGQTYPLVDIYASFTLHEVCRPDTIPP